MTHKIIFGLLIGVLLVSKTLQAQLRFQPFTSLEANVGISRLHSDLSPLSSLTQGYRWSGGVGAYRHLNPWLALGGSFDWTRVGADDFHSSNPETFFRNLHVRNDVKSINVSGKLYLLPFTSAIGRASGTWHPYVSAGIGYFFHNPKARSPLPERTWTELQPLRTEGQGFVPGAEEPYKLRGFQVPLGLGLERLEGRWLFGISAQVVFTGTDYLDDVKGNYYNLSGTYSQPLSDLQKSMAQRHKEFVSVRNRRDRIPGIRRYAEETFGFSPGSPDSDVIMVAESIDFGTNPMNPLLTLRGKVAGNDFYGTIRVKIVYTLRDGIRCP